MPRQPAQCVLAFGWNSIWTSPSLLSLYNPVSTGYEARENYAYPRVRYPAHTHGLRNVDWTRAERFLCVHAQPPLIFKAQDWALSDKTAVLPR